MDYPLLYTILLSTAKQGDNAIVRVFVCLFVYALRAVPSAAMSNNYHYQSKVIVYVSVISGRLRIITWMWSIGF